MFIFLQKSCFANASIEKNVGIWYNDGEFGNFTKKQQRSFMSCIKRMPMPDEYVYFWFWFF